MIPEQATRGVKCTNWICVREAGASGHSNGIVVMGSALGKRVKVGDKKVSPIFGAGGSYVQCTRGEAYMVDQSGDI